MGKVLGVKQILQKVFTLIENLPQNMRECFGEMEDSFTMIVWGASGNGKTNMMADFLKSIAHTGDILYVSFEEGHGKTMQDLVIRHNMEEMNIKFLDGEDYDTFYARMKKKKSPKIIVIDSWQYCGWNWEQYKKIKESFVFGKTPGKRKIFIIISHADGKDPKGASAKAIKFDANIKVRVEGFVGDIISRFGSTKNYLIWDQGAKGYWGKKLHKKINKLGAAKKIVDKAKKEESKIITKMQIADPAPKPVFKIPVEKLEAAL